MVFITISNKEEAERIGNVLLDKRFIACANIIENVDSRFWWKDKKEKAKESLLIAKTKKNLLGKLIKIVQKEHSYDVPEIIAIPIIAGYKPYFNWISEVTRKND